MHLNMFERFLKMRLDNVVDVCMKVLIAVLISRWILGNILALLCMKKSTEVREKRGVSKAFNNLNLQYQRGCRFVIYPHKELVCNIE